MTDTITLKTKHGNFIARAFTDENGYTGMLVEFVDDDDHGQHALRPTVRLELNDEYDELNVNIYDSSSEDAVYNNTYTNKGNGRYVLPESDESNTDTTTECDKDIDFAFAIDMNTNIYDVIDNGVSLRLQCNDQQYEALASRTSLLSDCNCTDFTNLLYDTDATMYACVDLYNTSLMHGTYADAKNTYIELIIGLESEYYGYKAYTVPLSQTEQISLINDYNRALARLDIKPMPIETAIDDDSSL